MSPTFGDGYLGFGGSFRPDCRTLAPGVVVCRAGRTWEVSVAPNLCRDCNPANIIAIAKSRCGSLFATSSLLAGTVPLADGVWSHCEGGKVCFADTTAKCFHSSQDTRSVGELLGVTLLGRFLLAKMCSASKTRAFTSMRVSREVAVV
jgi:hypothetical protein